MLPRTDLNDIQETKNLWSKFVDVSAERLTSRAHSERSVQRTQYIEDADPLGGKAPGRPFQDGTHATGKARIIDGGQVTKQIRCDISRTTVREEPSCARV